MLLNRLLIASLWNAGLYFAILAIKHILRDRASLRFHYSCWYILIASLVLPFFPAGIWSCWHEVSTAGSQSLSVYQIPDHSLITSKDTQWLRDTAQLIDFSNPDAEHTAPFLILWLLGVLVMIGYYLCGYFRLRHILKSAKPTHMNVRCHLETCCKQMQIRKNIQVLQSGAVSAPISFGFRKAFIVLPEMRTASLSDSELEHILLHELSHIRHKDLITNYMICGVQALYWFHPLVWLAFRQMRQDREAYCDWTVLDVLADESQRIAYGHTLLNFSAGGRMRFPAANALCQNQKELKYRLKRIVGFRPDTKRRKKLERCLMGILAFSFVFQVPLMAYCAEISEEYYTPSSSLLIDETDWGGLFFGRHGCAIIYDLESDRYTAYNRAEITRRVPPCSTYKIYAALNALEEGLITPIDSSLSWDGTEYAFPSWNRNHNLKSAMQGSVNWYFQELDRASGIRELSAFYKNIAYGNARLGNDPSLYWNGSALKISALEQVELLVQLYRNAFSFREENAAAVKDALYLGSSGSYRLYGKTGTGNVGGENVAGWFVGYVENDDNVYFFAVYLCDEQDSDGAAAVDRTLEILKTMGIEIMQLQ